MWIFAFVCNTETEETIPYIDICLYLPLQKKPAVSLLRSTEELARSGFIQQGNSVKEKQDYVADSNIGESR